MKVTLLSPVGVVGGAERVLLATLRDVAEHLPAARMDVVLLADGPLRAACEGLGVATTVVPLPAGLARQGDAGAAGLGRAGAVFRLGRAALAGVPELVGFLGRLRSNLRRLDPDLIHSHGIKAHALAALARPRGIPVLWHLHDFLAGRPGASRLLRRLAPRATGGIAVSEAVRRDAAGALPGLDMRTILNPTDPGHFAPADRDGADLDRLAGLGPADPGTVRIGLVATYARWKGQDVFLAALARLSATAAVRGYIVGGPIYTTAGSQFTEAMLRDRAADLGIGDRVGFVPHRRDPADAYRMLDVVVHASTRPEPFGLTIAEAMACGRPVVVSAAGGAVELFNPGHDGLGHPPGDAEGLARAIARLVDDPDLRRRLGANARRTAVERFDGGRFGREMAAAYRRAARPG